MAPTTDGPRSLSASSQQMQGENMEKSPEFLPFWSETTIGNSSFGVNHLEVGVQGMLVQAR